MSSFFFCKLSFLFGMMSSAAWVKLCTGLQIRVLTAAKFSRVDGMATRGRLVGWASVPPPYGD